MPIWMSLGPAGIILNPVSEATTVSYIGICVRVSVLPVFPFVPILICVCRMSQEVLVAIAVRLHPIFMATRPVWKRIVGIVVGGGPI